MVVIVVQQSTKFQRLLSTGSITGVVLACI
jgi:hypothetical protein